MSLALFLAHGHAYRGSHGYYQSGSWTTLRIPENASTCHCLEVLSELCKDSLLYSPFMDGRRHVCPRAEQAYSVASRRTHVALEEPC